MITNQNIAGVILAGGGSRRMGVDKALLKVDGITFIERIAATLERRFFALYISSNKADHYAFLNRPVIPDIFTQCGPLAGIHAALNHISTDYIFTVSCDVPFISTNVIDAFLDKLEPETILIADDGTRTHPLIGIYPRTMYNSLERYLQKGKRYAHGFLETVHVKNVDVSQFLKAVRNINTVDEYSKQI